MDISKQRIGWNGKLVIATVKLMEITRKRQTREAGAEFMLGTYSFDSEAPAPLRWPILSRFPLRRGAGQPGVRGGGLDWRRVRWGEGMRESFTLTGSSAHYGGGRGGQGRERKNRVTGEKAWTSQRSRTARHDPATVFAGLCMDHGGGIHG